MSFVKRIAPLFAVVVVLTMAAGTYMAAEQGEYSHKMHMEMGILCATCHNVKTADDAPAFVDGACAMCHEQASPPYGPYSKSRDLRGPFPHRRHAEMLDCATCHEAVATDSQAKGEPAMPIDRCFGCHSDYDIDTPVAKCASCHSANSIKTDPAYPFPHKPHADMLDCTGCHQGAQGIHPKGTTRMPVDRCFGCHTEYGVDVPAAKCTACHAVDMKNVRPPDHKSAWPIEHGIEARWRVFAQHGKDCELCHRNDACIACHKTTRPRSHTGLWRNRTHGTNAAWDRDSCKTCHETGQCIRCHQTTKPMNHRGGWTSVHGLSAQTKSNEHCFVCHKSGWCESCHRGK